MEMHHLYAMHILPRKGNQGLTSKQCMVAYAWNPGEEEAEAGVSSYPQLQREFEANMGCMRLCLKEEKKEEIGFLLLLTRCTLIFLKYSLNTAGLRFRVCFLCRRHYFHGEILSNLTRLKLPRIQTMELPVRSSQVFSEGRKVRPP